MGILEIRREVMKIKGQLEWTDYLEAQLLHGKPSGYNKTKKYGLFSIIAVLVLLYGFYLVVIGQISFLLFSPAFLFILLFLLYRYVFFPKKIKKVFSQQKSMQVPFEMEFTEEGLIASNEFGNSTYPWENFLKWKENDDILVIYQSDIMFNIIPKRCFSNDQEIENFKKYLMKNDIAADTKNKTLFVYALLFVVIVIMVLLNVR